MKRIFVPLLLVLAAVTAAGQAATGHDAVVFG